MAICILLVCVHVVHVIKTDMIADEMRDPRSAAALGFFIFFGFLNSIDSDASLVV